MHIVSASSVVAALEIKTTYKKNILKEALDSQLDIRNMIVNEMENPRMCTQIHFFKSTKKSLDDIYNDISSVLNSYRWNNKTTCNSILRTGPIVISCLDTFVSFVMPDAKGKCILKVFMSGNLSFSLAISDLFGFIAGELNNNADLFDLDELIQKLDISGSKKGVIKLCN